MPIFRGTVVSVQHLVSSVSLGDCSVHRLREDWLEVYLYKTIKTELYKNIMQPSGSTKHVGFQPLLS